MDELKLTRPTVEELQSVQQENDTCSSKVEFSQHYVVGVGASAGGLEALEKLFESVPEKSGMSYVVVQHLSPDFRSHMDELLKRVTRITVRVVENGMPIAPDTIYLIPPKSEMVISNGKLLLTERSTDKGVNHPIDMFFRSLAQERQRYAVAIVLSGTGSDGSRGVTEIADNGGLVIAQDPKTCKFDAMPLNAQETGNVHLILPPESMGEALCQYVSEGTTPKVLRDQQLGQLEETGLKRVFQLLQREHNIDFSHYKPSTVERRIQRRMELLKLPDLQDYVERLNGDRVEINELYEDLLIGVTRFFRDEEAFDFLQQSVLPKLIERAGNETLRVWVCGCATGEEAYSLAIIILEAYRKLEREPDFKMFATDAYKPSLQFAATGIFPESRMQEVSEDRRQRYFAKRRDGYYVSTEIRRHIVFAPHNLIADPPFTQMHLVVCRNLLIYLQPAAQRKSLSLLHFALRQNGVLFLGPSESPGDISDEFEPLQKTWKVFRKRRDVRLPVDLRLSVGQRFETQGISPLRSTFDLPARPSDIMPSLYDLILGDMMPPSILIDSQFQLLHAFPGTEPYMRFVPGIPTTNVLELIYPAIKNSLAAAIQHSLRDGTQVRYSGMPHPKDGGKQVQLMVRPYKPSKLAQTYLLIQFETTESEGAETKDTHFEDVNLGKVASSRIDSLEQDLSHMQQNLQATIEELETSNEELQATNEEMVAANEELQSTNEELHSVNEELYTVNAEHQKRVKELDEANADMHNLLATTQVGVVFLDREFAIRRFTPVVGQMLYMEPNDVGRSIDSFVSRFDDDRFLDRLKSVMETRTQHEWEIVCDNRTFLARAMPYWTGTEVAGVVVSFVNIDAIKRTESELARFKFMADRNIDAQVLLDAHARIIYANEKMIQSLGYDQAEMQKVTVPDFDCEHDYQAYRNRFEESRKTGGGIYESTHIRKDGKRIPVEVAVTFVEFSGQPFLFATIRDVTSRRKANRRRRLLEKAIEAVGSGIVISDPRVKDNPLTFVNSGFCNITGYSREEILGKNCRFLQGPETDPKSVITIRDGIRHGEPTRVLIRNYRKDGKPFWNDVFITPVRDATEDIIAFVGVQSDVTERVEASELLQKGERTIRTLLNSTAEGIFGQDLQGFCTFINQSAVNLLGYQSPDELVGKQMHELIHYQHPDGSEYLPGDCPIQSTIRTGRASSSEHDHFFRKDGSSFPVEYWCHPLMESDACIGAVVTFVDMSSRKQELEELRRARALADSANEAKSQFLANMSHELRTPLAAILGFTQIMQEESDDAESIERLATIQRNGEYLLRLLNDILDLSRIEAGKLQLMVNITRLDELLSDVNQTMQMRVSDSNSTLTFQLKNPLPSTISTDPARLRQVLINLIGNAIKFSPGGLVQVTVWTETSVQGKDKKTWLCIEVRDNGIGMSPLQLERLFQPFSQANSTIAQRFGGSGLGLSISNRLTESLGGDIEVESREGSGSCFTIRIPVEPVGDAKELTLENENSPPSLVPNFNDPSDIRLEARVLIVDDMRDVRFIATHFLSKVGCQVSIAENGREAIRKIDEAVQKGEPFDLVLMDIQMPEMNGEEAARLLREKGFTTPIIALTADAMKGTRRRLIAAGFDDYLTKPLNRSRLLQVAGMLIKQRY